MTYFQLLPYEIYEIILYYCDYECVKLLNRESIIDKAFIDNVSRNKFFWSDKLKYDGLEAYIPYLEFNYGPIEYKLFIDKYAGYTKAYVLLVNVDIDIEYHINKYTSEPVAIYFPMYYDASDEDIKNFISEVPQNKDNCNKMLLEFYDVLSENKNSDDFVDNGIIRYIDGNYSCTTQLEYGIKNIPISARDFKNFLIKASISGVDLGLMLNIDIDSDDSDRSDSDENNDSYITKIEGIWQFASSFNNVSRPNVISPSNVVSPPKIIRIEGMWEFAIPHNDESNNKNNNGSDADI